MIEERKNMKAVEYFKNGYSCSESIIKEAIDNGIVPQELISIATPFSGGLGSGCLCGAISASQIIIGYLYGKENVFGNEVCARAKAKEFLSMFKNSHKASCCRVLTAGMDMASPERKNHCASMLNDCTKILEEIIKVKV